MPSSNKRARPSLESLLLSLVKAIRQQAEAIDRLAASNEELVNLPLDEREQPADEDADQGFDMAGKPLTQ